MEPAPLEFGTSQHWWWAVTLWNGGHTRESSKSSCRIMQLSRLRKNSKGRAAAGNIFIRTEDTLDLLKVSLDSLSAAADATGI